MKTRIGLGMLALTLTAMGAHGTIYTEAFTGVNTFIPDGNPVGIISQETVGNIPTGVTVIGLTVGLNLSGGYAGNLYAYLVSPTGTMVTLFNQAGGGPFGNPSPAINLTLQDGGTAITSTTDLSTGGPYAAAGNLIDMNGSTADGSWTLFFADVVSGGGTTELNGWTLNIAVVPEPANVALLVFGGLGGLWWLGRRLSGKTIPAQAQAK